eukprot:403333611
MSFIDEWLSSIKSVGKTMGILLLLLNIFMPGVGTIINALMGHGISGTGLLIGFVQMITSFMLLGWIWSIWWGVEIAKRSGSF